MLTSFFARECENWWSLLLTPCYAMQTFQGLQWKECLALLCRTYPNMVYEAELLNFFFIFGLSFCLLHTKCPCYSQYSVFATLPYAFSLSLYIQLCVWVCFLIIIILDSGYFYQPSLQNSYNFLMLLTSSQGEKVQ